MHIAEGVLTAPVLLTGIAASAVGVAWGLPALRSPGALVRASLGGAAFFCASLIHLPLGPTSTHLMLNGLAGLLAGRAAFPVILAGLLLQCLIFQFGGLTVLGINTLSMAGGALAAHAMATLLARRGRGASRHPDAVVFLAAALAVLVSALITATALAASGDAFRPAAAALLLASLPVMVVDGLITALALRLLRRRAPELLGELSPGELS